MPRVLIAIILLRRIKMIVHITSALPIVTETYSLDISILHFQVYARLYMLVSMSGWSAPQLIHVRR